MIIVPVIPLELLLFLALVGCALGSVVNLAAYRLAWRPRAISPWSAPPPKAPRRRWSDHLPVVGWIGLRREWRLHGRGFWLRPMIVELLCGALLPGLFWWEQDSLLHCRALVMADPREAALATANLALALRMMYLSQALLALAMIAMSLIDVDEKFIPDAITVPGLLAGLLLATVYPWSLLPDKVWLDPAGIWRLDFTRLTSPDDWPAAPGGARPAGALLAALACWWIWIAGLMRRRWIGRRGWRTAWRWFWAGLLRDSRTRPLAALGVAGSALVAAVWRWAETPHWAGLATALVGAAIGGVVVWLVRVIGALTLKREAMGFGDVTLMAMIGAFVGWQASLLVFFVAPFLGLALGLVRLALRRDHEIPFGPFLCLATFGVILDWTSLWPAAEGLFAAPWLLAAAILLSLVAMAGLLAAWRWFRERVLKIT